MSYNDEFSRLLEMYYRNLLKGAVKTPTVKPPLSSPPTIVPVKIVEKPYPCLFYELSKDELDRLGANSAIDNRKTTIVNIHN